MFIYGVILGKNDVIFPKTAAFWVWIAVMVVTVFQKCILSAFNPKFSIWNTVTAATAILDFFVFIIFITKYFEKE